MRYVSSVKERDSFVSVLEKKKIDHFIIAYDEGVFEIRYKEPADTILK